MTSVPPTATLRPHRPGARAFVLLLALLGGCMTVHLEGVDPQVRVVRHLGVLHVEVPQADRAVVGELQGLGFVSTPMGTTAGYTRQRWASLGPQCRAVVWLDSPHTPDAALQAALDRLRDVAGVCLLEPSAHANGQRKGEPAP